jgi:hypothetical protein
VLLSKAEALTLRQAIDNYKQASGSVTYELRDAIGWCLREGLLTVPSDVALTYLLPRASEALRLDVVSVGPGHPVRRRHCVRRTVRDPETGDLVQRTFWGDLEAPPEFLQESIRQRLEAVRADLRSVEADVAYLAANRPELAPRLTQMLARFNPRDEG